MLSPTLSLRVSFCKEWPSLLHPKEFGKPKKLLTLDSHCWCVVKNVQCFKLLIYKINISIEMVVRLQRRREVCAFEFLRLSHETFLVLVDITSSG